MNVETKLLNFNFAQRDSQSKKGNGKTTISIGKIFCTYDNVVFNIGLGGRTTKTRFFFFQVKERTSNYNNYAIGSHVMEYGDTNIKAEKLYLYQGFDPATANFPPHNGKLGTQMEVVNQRDAELFFMWQMVYAYFPINSSYAPY